MAVAHFSQAPGLSLGVCLLERWASWPSYSLLEAFCHQPGVSMASAEPNGWDVFHQLLRSGEVPARLCTDAYLAAVAIANGWRLVSFDREFERFDGLERLARPGAQA